MDRKQGRIYQHVRSFFKVLDGYTGGMLLSRFLTGFFKENRQMGSKDRRTISRFAYHYFRLGKSAAGLDPLDRLVIAEFLCADQSPLVAAESEELAAVMEAVRETGDGSGIDLGEHKGGKVVNPLDVKIAFLEEKTSFRLADVFPYARHISGQIDRKAFIRQLFVQPDLFLRMRLGQEARVIRVLEKHGVEFKRMGTSTLALPNSTALHQIRALEGLIEIQDLSSQRTLDHLAPAPGEHWWDACAGAGGKSLLLLDKYPGLHLLVSDVRNSVLKNLDSRFEAAGIKTYRRKLIDLTRDTAPVLGDEQFDGIVIDAPCTGSGTWGRTPEQMSFFEGDVAIGEFVRLQQSIVTQAVRHLRPGKPLVYITCSVFEAENEGVVDYIRRELGLQLVSMEYLHGYKEKADTMFVATLVSPNRAHSF